MQRIMRGKKTEKKGMKDVERINQATRERPPKRKQKQSNVDRTNIKTYYVTKSSLMGSELLVAVWHYGKYGRNFCIGHTTIRLDEFCFRDPSSQFNRLKKYTIHAS